MWVQSPSIAEESVRSKFERERRSALVELRKQDQTISAELTTMSVPTGTNRKLKQAVMSQIDNLKTQKGYANYQIADLEEMTLVPLWVWPLKKSSRYQWLNGETLPFAIAEGNIVCARIFSIHTPTLRMYFFAMQAHFFRCVAN